MVMAKSRERTPVLLPPGGGWSRLLRGSATRPDRPILADPSLGLWAALVVPSGQSKPYLKLTKSRARRSMLTNLPTTGSVLLCYTADDCVEKKLQADCLRGGSPVHCWGEQ